LGELLKEFVRGLFLFGKGTSLVQINKYEIGFALVQAHHVDDCYSHQLIAQRLSKETPDYQQIRPQCAKMPELGSQSVATNRDRPQY
jgi:hypothetical protein